MDGEKMGAELSAIVRSFVTRSLAKMEETIVQRLDKHSAQLETTERRLSRHGEHLRRLEDRMQSLEKRGDK